MSSIPPGESSIRRKAAFDAWEASITRVSEVIADFEACSNTLRPLCTPESALQDTFGQPAPPLSHGMALEASYRYLDQKIGELEKIEQRMVRMRRELIGLRNRSLDLVPANKLPPEVLSYIFLLGVEQIEYELEMAESEPEDDEEEPPQDIVPFNLLVSQVCRRWRTIAINTATLWTHIDFSDHPPHNLTCLFLERSKHAILDVNLTLTDIDDLESEEHIRMGMEILDSHVSRIGSLSVDASAEMQLDLILATFLEKCEPRLKADGRTQTALRKLKLVDVSGSGNALAPEVSRERLSFVLQTMKGLEDVTLEGVALPWHSPAFEELKCLHLAGLKVESEPSEHQFITILKNCPQLERLAVEEAGISLGTGHDVVRMRREVRPILLDRLQTLHLSMMPWNEMEFIFHVVNAPNLQNLWIDSPMESISHNGTVVDDGQQIEGLPRDEHMLKTIALFLNRSHANPSQRSFLQSLHMESLAIPMSYDDASSPQLMEVLKAVPHLRTLELYEIAVGDDILASLSAKPSLSAPSSPSKPPSMAPSMSASMSSIVGDHVPSSPIHPPTSFAQYEFDEDDEDDGDWADEDSMEVDANDPTPPPDLHGNVPTKKITPICQSLRVLKLSLIDDITLEALQDLLTSRKNRGSPLTLKLIDVFDEDLEELRAELEPLCHSLNIQHDGNNY